MAEPWTSDVEEFRSAVTGVTGLRFEDDKLPLFTDLLAARMRATGSTSSEGYIERFRSTPSEASEVARVLTVPETYFLRNRDQFRALEVIVKQRAARSPRPLRLLSAGCSSGEEPYSLAMVVRESLGAAARSVSIVGLDLNPDALAKAGAGIYTSWSLRETPENIQGKYFRGQGRRGFVLDESIRDTVHFEQRNLACPAPAFWRHGAFDVIFCRNVLMYFTPEMAAEVVARFACSLTPDGFLFLGHAENLRGLSREFHLRHTHGTFYYQKRARLDLESPPASGGRPYDVESVSERKGNDHTSWVGAITRSADRVEALSRRSRDVPGPHAPPPLARAKPSSLEAALQLLKEERYREALVLLPSTGGATGEDLDGLLLRAVLLVSSGTLREAEDICDRILAIDELNAGAHYVLALCREHAGDPDLALEHDRIASYLDADFAMPHLHLGLLARRAGDRVTARRELRLAQGLLSREDGARIVLFGGGFGREALIDMCRAELEACGEGVRP